MHLVLAEELTLSRAHLAWHWRRTLFNFISKCSNSPGEKERSSQWERKSEGAGRAKCWRDGEPLDHLNFLEVVERTPVKQNICLQHHRDNKKVLFRRFYTLMVYSTRSTGYYTHHDPYSMFPRHSLDFPNIHSRINPYHAPKQTRPQCQSAMKFHGHQDSSEKGLKDNDKNSEAQCAQHNHLLCLI